AAQVPAHHLDLGQIRDDVRRAGGGDPAREALADRYARVGGVVEADRLPDDEVVVGLLDHEDGARVGADRVAQAGDEVAQHVVERPGGERRVDHGLQPAQAGGE